MTLERISRAESHEQRKKLQLLLMEAYMTDFPEIGLLVATDAPEYLAELLARAKQSDPALRNMIIGQSTEGIIIYHDQSKDINLVKAKGESENDEKNPDASNGEAHSDL